MFTFFSTFPAEIILLLRAKVRQADARRGGLGMPIAILINVNDDLRNDYGNFSNRNATLACTDCSICEYYANVLDPLDATTANI